MVSTIPNPDFVTHPCFGALYLSLGPLTSTQGVRDVSVRLTRENNGNDAPASYAAPLLLKFPTVHIQEELGKPDLLVTETDYYFWFFGFTAKLPYEGSDSRYLTVAATNAKLN